MSIPTGVSVRLLHNAIHFANLAAHAGPLLVLPAFPLAGPSAGVGPQGGAQRNTARGGPMILAKRSQGAATERDPQMSAQGRPASMSIPLRTRPAQPPVFHSRLLINGLEYDAAIVRPAFGAGFTLHIHVRIPPGLAGAGSWEVMPGYYRDRAFPLLGPAIGEVMRAIAQYAGYGI